MPRIKPYANTHMGLADILSVHNFHQSRPQIAFKSRYSTTRNLVEVARKTARSYNPIASSCKVSAARPLGPLSPLYASDRDDRAQLIPPTTLYREQTRCIARKWTQRTASRRRRPGPRSCRRSSRSSSSSSSSTSSSSYVCFPPALGNRIAINTVSFFLHVHLPRVVACPMSRW